jgi:hypothetical protein
MDTKYMSSRGGPGALSWVSTCYVGNWFVRFTQTTRFRRGAALHRFPWDIMDVRYIDGPDGPGVLSWVSTHCVGSGLIQFIQTTRFRRGAALHRFPWDLMDVRHVEVLDGPGDTHQIFKISQKNLMSEMNLSQFLQSLHFERGATLTMFQWVHMDTKYAKILGITSDIFHMLRHLS